MGAIKYTITVESDTPPQITLGQNIGGGKVVKMQQEDVALVTAAHLALKYSLSVNTVRNRLISINQGTDGKHLYDPALAHTLLTTKSERRGRKRAN